MKTVSVVIPFYNSLDALGICLEALQRQDYPAESFEVIAVDNGSTAPTDAIRSKFPAVRWLHEAQPGAYHARNHGIRNSTAEVIALTDADCVPDPAWLREAVSALEANATTLIGGRIEYLNPPGRDLNVCERFEDQFFMLAKHRQLVEQLGVVATANVVTYRAVFERSGFFDSRLMSFGDGEWALRAVAKGEVLRYADKAIIRHPRRGTFREIFKKVRRLAGDKVVLIRQRNEGAVRQAKDLYRHSIFNPRVQYYALCFRGLKGFAQKWQMFAVVESLSLVNTAERIRVLLGGGAYRG